MLYANNMVESSITKSIQNNGTSFNGESSFNGENNQTSVPMVLPPESDAEVVKFLGSDNCVLIPNNIEELNNFITQWQAKKAVGVKLMERFHKQGQAYIDVFNKTQQMAECLLDSELRMGQQLKRLPTKQGMRTDLQHTDDTVCKCKKEIMSELGISERVAYELQRLTPEAVDKAKKMAQLQHKVVSREQAKNFIRKEHYNQNNIKTDFNGIFDSNERPNAEKIALIKQIKQPVYYTQLFASAGVGEEKLELLGLFPTVANELEADRCKWYQERHPDCKVIPGSITDEAVFEQLVVEHLAKRNNAVLASPVCRDFSNAGKRNFDNPRARLIFRVLEFLRRVNATTDYVLIENVPQFLTASPENWPEINGEHKINLGEYITQELEKLGYWVNIATVYGCDYGTAQKRQRAFILASKKGLWAFPKKDRYWKTLFETIGHLPSLEPGQKSDIKWHDAPKVTNTAIEALRHTPEGQSFRSNKQEQSYDRRNEWGKPAGTVLQQNDTPGGYSIYHPGRPLSDGTQSDPRPFSILELLLITGLDENYCIPKWAPTSLIRSVLGDCLLPNVNLALCSMIPGRQ